MRADSAGPVLAVQFEGVVSNFESGVEVVRTDELRSELRSGQFLKRAQRYRKVELHLNDFHNAWRPWVWSVLLRMLSTGEACVIDRHGTRRAVTCGQILRDAAGAGRDWLCAPAVIRRTRRDVRQLLNSLRSSSVARSGKLSIIAGRVLYLRSDLVFGLVSGGSVGHTAGVLNSLAALGSDPVWITTDRLHTIDSNIETHVIRPRPLFINRPDVRPFAFGHQLESSAAAVLGSRKPSFIYHRYAMYDYTGVRLARRYSVPLVLEFNGSEVWASRNWGAGAVPQEGLARQIEELNLRAADLIVVVSEPLRAQLLAAGIPDDRILVNPNGVDPVRYSPETSCETVRRRYGLEGRTVIGFIGTFGRWHGGEVLADAFGRLLRQHPDLRDRLHLLLIGDGRTMPEVRSRLAAHGVRSSCSLTGLIPQAEGPAHLAACDVLVSPHVGNADGSSFFGSPTKLFEYMAMQRGIVASRLGQIDDILRHEQTALLVPPGDADELAAGILRLATDAPLRHRLAQAAREKVIRHHTWRRHTERILDAVEQRLGPLQARTSDLQSAA